MSAADVIAHVVLVLGLAAVIACVWAPVWAHDEACRDAEEARKTLPTPDDSGAGGNSKINVYEKE
jgi:hypothetical protein